MSGNSGVTGGTRRFVRQDQVANFPDQGIELEPVPSTSSIPNVPSAVPSAVENNSQTSIPLSKLRAAFRANVALRRRVQQQDQAQTQVSKNQGSSGFMGLSRLRETTHTSWKIFNFQIERFKE